MALKDKTATHIAEGVLDYLKKNGKSELLDDVINELNKKKEAHKAFIYVPYKLDSAEEKKMLSFVSKVTKEKIDQCDFIQDGTLVDGFKVIYKNRLWDYSLSTQIKGILETI